MKFSRVLSFVLATLLLFGTLSISVRAEGENITDPSVQRGCKTIEAQVPLYGTEKFLDTAQAAVLYEVNSDTLMYAWNPDERLEPASLVKIMTCLLTIENCDLTEKVKVTESAVSSLDKSNATLSLQPGEEFTVDQLLYGLMVGSANDAAVVLAEHVAGSQAAFVKMMNDRAQEIGCKDTCFVNSHGLPAEGQYTTARDMVRLMAVAIRSEDYIRYAGETYHDLLDSEGNERDTLQTTNYLMTIGTELYYDSRVTSGRTGISNNKRSIAVSAKSGELELISVVLQATPIYNDKGIVTRFGSYEETKQLLNMGFDDHQIYQVLYDGQILTRYSVSNGRNAVALGPVSSVSALLPVGTKFSDLTVRYGVPNGSLSAPIEAGERITAVEVWHGSVCVAYSPIVAMNGSKVNDGSLLQENRYGGGAKVWVVILIILLVVAVLAGVVLVGLRAFHGVRRAQLRNLHRRRRSDRRRTR